jgi:hypothetical protein
MEISRLAPVAFVNTHSSEIPPFGVMQITNAIADGNDLVYQVTRPTAAVIAYGSASRYLFNGDGYVPQNGRGGGFFPAPQVQALVLPGPTVGLGDYLQFLSPVTDQWYLGSGWHYEAVIASDPLGIHEEGSARVWRVQNRTQNIFRLITTAAVTVSSGTSELQKWNGTSFVASGVTKEVRSTIGSLATGVDCLATIINNILCITEICE